MEDLLIPPKPKLSSEYGTIYTEQDIRELVDKYDLSEYKKTQIIETIRCESRFKNVQSDIVSKDVREDSWGIVQIHLPSHQNVSKQQALDPEFAVAFISKAFEQNQMSMWSCYRKLY